MDERRLQVAKRLAWLFHKSQAVNADTSADEWWECIGTPQQNRWLALADAILPLLGLREDDLTDDLHGWAEYIAARAEWGDK